MLQYEDDVIHACIFKISNDYGYNAWTTQKNADMQTCV